MTLQVLVWRSDSFGEHYYDVSTQDLLHAASLEILQTRLDMGFWVQPPPTEDYGGTYEYYKRRRDTLETALGDDPKSEAFTEMHRELDKITRNMRAIEKRAKYEQEEYDRVARILLDQDGEAAFDLIMEYSDFDDESISYVVEPKRAVRAETKENAEA